MAGLELQIFWTPAVSVTIKSHARGTNATSASTGFPTLGVGPLIAPEPDGDGRTLDSFVVSCIFKMTVTARHKAIAASIWFAIPNKGQSELIPPSGSRTP